MEGFNQIFIQLVKLVLDLFVYLSGKVSMSMLFFYLISVVFFAMAISSNLMSLSIHGG